MQEMLDSEDVLVVLNLFSKQNKNYNEICIAASKIASFSFYIDGDISVKELGGNCGCHQYNVIKYCSIKSNSLFQKHKRRCVFLLIFLVIQVFFIFVFFIIFLSEVSHLSLLMS